MKPPPANQRREAMGDAVHTWLESNDRDIIALFECVGGVRDGQVLGVPWDAEQAKGIADYINDWLVKRQRRTT